ncbi:hypothetical protein D3C81_2223050 [compost metagenome]
MRFQRDFSGELRRYRGAMGHDVADMARSQPEPYQQADNQKSDKQNGKREG